ncbi:cytochrome-c peroxidase [Caulobacter sp. UNC279MFTsu5.1]|uniref:cytochrome-c peroxidase n=1 Tax=Caulobacter sp. UNC279MFTsu5.1 TaxID=1502775 RepID=UPI0008F0EF77|nr:cytochrome c peroxidase [Caulobacter sp. UNC279MFTsu5.1]SFI53851.1 cytochrome c peroxidase [Caulobacter sp. UNC279MFTsu5.1]
MKGMIALGALAMAAAVAADAWPRDDAETMVRHETGQAFRPVATKVLSRREAAQARLGEALFADPRLSGKGTRACVSCHDLATNGASARANDLAPDGRALAFNTPTVFNAATSFRLNWEGRFRSLETQARRSIENPAIMGGDPGVVASRLGADPAIRSQFVAAFGRDPNAEDVAAALARFETTLITPDARFDRYLRGDTAALEPQALRGYRLFQSAGCSSCHQGVNIGGNLFQRSGVFHTLTDPRAPIMRVPSLRNVETTAPYFHDGSARTLEDAIRAMGRSQLNRVLTPAQVDDIAAFLRSLTGQYRGRSVRARE